MSNEEKKELEALMRRVVREELDKYDRDKGISPRTRSDGSRGDLPYPFGNYP